MAVAVVEVVEGVGKAVVGAEMAGEGKAVVMAVEAVGAKCLDLKTAVAVIGEAVVANGIDLEFAVAVVLAVQQETLDSLVSNAWGLRI